MSERVAAMRAAIAEAAREAGRDPSSVALLAVTKGQPRAAVLASIGAGIAAAASSFAHAEPVAVGHGK